ncbi:hypothetical protein IscW_ISCW006528 [Ixodes scapularis]|uniref:Uncharacterized protein n=1 Tax=Ixodes scapularis TaxID=6945 RepID=B7PNT7_IXOSC|nr:hypothetical protein IscW_ISCW006528 [Ixodes scapularis]|eukprot:XP_002435429.1 hypothetical protein IscW_ISCW006528 [Ixodes scapularis]
MSLRNDETLLLPEPKRKRQHRVSWSDQQTQDGAQTQSDDLAVDEGDEDGGEAPRGDRRLSEFQADGYASLSKSTLWDFVRLAGK